MIRFFRKKSSKNQTFGKSLVKVDCVIVAVAHDDFKQMKFKDFLLAQWGSAPRPCKPCKGLVFFYKKKKCGDVRGMFDGKEAKEKGFYYRRL
ncbi:MAG: hypothetical protein QMD22_10400 [archaeon]|nr:hypothetical protein [archaeon]